MTIRLGISRLPAPPLTQPISGSLPGEGWQGWSFSVDKGRRLKDSPRPHSLGNQRRGTRTQVSQPAIDSAPQDGGSPEPAAPRAPSTRHPTSSSEAATSKGCATGRWESIPHARAPPFLARPEEAAGSGRRNARGTKPQAVAAHSPQLRVYTGAAFASAIEILLPAASSRKKPLKLSFDWLKELSFSRGSSPASNQ